MKEINNNIHNYGYQVDKVMTNKDKQTPPPLDNVQETAEKSYIADTGVLGRSQILNGANIAKSVDEAVDMAENHPEELLFCEDIVDAMYQNYLDEGLNESDAYMNALLGEEYGRELLNIVHK